MALTHTPENELNTPCPHFKLRGTDEKIYQLTDFADGNPLLVMFLCNHCPYVKAIEDRLIELGQDLQNQNIHVFGIASNDSIKYPEDSFANLKKRAREKNYPFIYLFDETQEVAKSFGAVCTPDFFGYDSHLMLRYRGRLDDSWKDPGQVTQRELFHAMMKLKNNQPLTEKQTPSMGCSIKWKTSS